MTREATADQIREALLATDVTLLNEINVSDETMSLMAGEHAARVETLGKAIEPTLGRSLLLMVAGRLLAAAKQIDLATVLHPELVTHA